MAAQYDELRSDKVLATLDRLRHRIDARFSDPRRGLSAVAGELGVLISDVVEKTEGSRHRVDRLRRVARLGVGLVVLVTVVALWLVTRSVVADGPDRAVDWLPLAESTINDIVFAGIAVLFLWALPERLERRRLLGLLHRTRTMAHVIDMHQVSKDPEQVADGYVPTTESVQHHLGPEELHHYFNYCSELLSLVAKTAALCAEHSSDGVVLDTVRSIESLTTDMSQKIWQKISLLPHS